MAGGILSTLFGTSPSVTYEPNVLQTSLSGQQQYIQKILTDALSGAGGTSQYVQSLFPSYTGQLGAAPSAATTGAVSGLTSNLGGATTAASGVPSTYSSGLGALSGVMSGQPQDLQSYFATNIYAPAEQTLTQTTLPGIMSSAGGSVGGYESTSESRSVADAISSAYSGMAGTAADTAYQTAMQNVSDKTQALNQLSTITGLPSNLLSVILKSGTTAQGAQQTSLDKLYSDYQSGLVNTQDFVTSIVNYLNTQTQTAANQYTTTSGSSGLLGSLFSGLGSSTLGKTLGNLIVSPSGSSPQ